MPLVWERMLLFWWKVRFFLKIFQTDRVLKGLQKPTIILLIFNYKQLHQQEAYPPVLLMSRNQSRKRPTPRLSLLLPKLFLRFLFQNFFPTQQVRTREANGRS